uniref:Uncharacterized protein n=1 Tax=Dechloromonas aromatica (strain RCB) TaxID=159087 RepID=Q47IQ6_DECAR
MRYPVLVYRRNGFLNIAVEGQRCLFRYFVCCEGEMEAMMSELQVAPVSNDKEAWWKRRNLQLDTFSKLFSIVGVAGALSVATIAYLNYQSQLEENDRAASVLDMRVNTETIPISDSKCIVLVNIDLTNKGRRAINPYAHTDDDGGEQQYSGEGLTLSVTRHSIPSKDAPIAEDAPDDIRVVPRYNILEKKYSYRNTRRWDEIYVIKPNTSYRETEAITLQRHALYEIRARFYAFRRAKNGEPEVWTNTETKYLYVE